MPHFNDFVITDAGMAYKTLFESGSKPFFISKVTIGDGAMPAGKTLESVTDLYHVRTDMPVTIIGLSDVPPATQKIKTSLNSASLTADIQMTEAGVWAKNPDNSEILYAYTYAGEDGEKVKTSSFLYEENWNINLVTGRFASLTVKVEGSMEYTTSLLHLASVVSLGRQTLKQAQENSRLKHRTFGG